MKYVRQKRDGCAVACYAMVTGRPYDWALKRLPVAKSGRGVRRYELTKQLWRAGFFVKTRFYVKKIGRLKNTCILLVWEPGETVGHAVVWDPESQKILDPDRRRPHTIAWYEKHLRIVMEIKK